MKNEKLGKLIINWKKPQRPSRLSFIGKYASLSLLSAEKHSENLFKSFNTDKDHVIWKYLPYGPFTNFKKFKNWLKSIERIKDPYFLTIKKLDQKIVCGMASYLRIKPVNGSIEVGHINFSPILQNTTAATEAMFIMMNWAFENGYRRYEWKCDALNIKSRKAALRLGFSYEGIFKQAQIVKGRNRDTAWFAIIDKEWKNLKNCFKIYLSPNNFDKKGNQIISLSSLTKKIR